MLGNTKENLMGFDILSRIKDTDLTNAVKDSLSKGSGYFEGVYYSILTNKNTPVRVLFEGIKNEKGEIYGGVVLAEDISERIGTENALKESEEKFRVLVENQGEGIGVTDQSNSFIFANPAAEQIFGVPPGGLQNKSLKDFTSVEEFRKLEVETQNRIEGKRSTYELEIIRPDGEKRNILATVTPRLDEKGKYQSSIGIFMDITERKKIELHLKNTLEFNKRIINNAFTGIIVYDRHFNYLLWNPVMEEISGYRANEVIGKNAFEIFSHYKKEGMDKILHRALEGETIVRESVRYTLPEKNKQGWTREVFSPNYDGRGKIIGVIAIVSEITRLKEFQNSLEEKNKEIAEQNVELIKAINRAKQSDRLKSAFLRTMSHEIRTPLNAIIGFSDLFNMELDKDELNYYTNSIHQNGLQLLNIIDDIFHISQLESGGADVSKENFDLKEFLHEIRRLTREEMKLAGKEHLELKLHLEEGFERIKVNTDQEKVKHVFLNLLKNAVKFTFEGFIEFGYLFRKDGDLMFFVRDSGIGIPEDKHHLIFERFRQIDERFTRKYGGTGLGLYPCVKILEVLSGKIWLESKVGEGTVFYFTIDNIFEEKEQVRKSIQKEKINFDYIFPGTKILIAEDEYSNFFLLQKMLKNAQAEIIHVENGLEAVEILRKNPDVDLVLMDIKMPVVDGYEASRRIRKFNAKVIILAQTAYALAGDQQKALEAGCNGYISKPIQKRDLMEKLKMFLM
nr:PAS domain S-box protein [Bacteroidota bacterium]